MHSSIIHQQKFLLRCLNKIDLLVNNAGALFLNRETNSDNVEKTFSLIGACIERIYEGETVHERVDFSDKELSEFLDSLTSDQFQNVQSFFETMPKLKHEVKFKNPKTKKQNKVTLEGLQSFFV